MKGTAKAVKVKHMKTTYKMIYKALNDNGKIDEIINKYSKDENIQIVKAYIINGIEMTAELFNSKEFKEMNYWFNDNEELNRLFGNEAIKFIVVKEIEKAYGKIAIKEIEENKKYVEYMLTMIK